MIAPEELQGCCPAANLRGAGAAIPRFLPRFRQKPVRQRGHLRKSLTVLGDFIGERLPCQGSGG